MKKSQEIKQVILAMFRHNPQLGAYCTIQVVDVVKVTNASVMVDYYGSRKSFDFFGNEKKPTEAVYGTAIYKIFVFEAAKELFDGEKFNGYRISSGKEVFEKIQNSNQ